MRNPHNERLGSDIPEDRPESSKPSGTESGVPQRRCILSGETDERGALLRLAVSPVKPDGTCDVMPDVLARAPGRGAWIGVNRAELETAMAKGKLKGALARAFGKAPGAAALTIPEDLADRIEAALLRVVTDRLGLELKSGRLLMGSDRIAENARQGRVAWLAHAADAREDGSRKLDQAWRVGQDAEGSGLRGVTLPLDRMALSVALGRDNVVHLALTDSAAALRVAAPLQRLLQFQGQAAATGQDVNGLSAAQADQQSATTIKD